MFVNRVTTRLNVKQRMYDEATESHSVDRKAESRWRERFAENADAECNSSSSRSSQYDLNVSGLQGKVHYGVVNASKFATGQSRLPISHSSSNLVLNQSRQLIELSNSMDQLNVRASNAQSSLSETTDSLKKSSNSLTVTSGSAAKEPHTGLSFCTPGPHGINVNITSVRSSVRNYQQMRVGNRLSHSGNSYSQMNAPIEISVCAARSSDFSPNKKKSGSARTPQSSGGSPVPRLRIFVADEGPDRQMAPSPQKRISDDESSNDPPDIQPGLVKQRLEELIEQQANHANGTSHSAMHPMAKCAKPSAFRPVGPNRPQAQQQLDNSASVSRTSYGGQSTAYSPHRPVHAAGGNSPPYASGTPVALRRSYDPLFTVSPSNNQLNPNATQATSHVTSSIPHSVRAPASSQPSFAQPNASHSGPSLPRSNYAQLLSPSRVQSAIYQNTACLNTPLSSGQSTVCATPTTPTHQLERSQAHATREVCASGVSSVDSGVVTELSQSRASLHQIDQRSYYENLLREKSLEVQHLRNTMEQNEEAMTRVFEARKQEWFNEYEALRAEADRRIALERDRCSQFEQQVQFLTAQLEEMHNTLDSTSRLSQQVHEMDQTNRSFAQQLDNVKWALQQKQGELSLLRTQYKDSQNEARAARQHVQQLEMHNTQLRKERTKLENKASTLETAMKELAENLEQVTRELLHLQNSKSVQARNEAATQTENCETDLQHAQALEQIAFLENTIQSREQEFEHERSQWLEEKAKVINYQKQLQLNYLQMSQRNKRLESELRQVQMNSELIVPP